MKYAPLLALLLIPIAGAQTYYDKTTIPPKLPAYTSPVNGTNATAAPTSIHDYLVNCTNGSTGAADYTLISNAVTSAGAAGGGVVRLAAPCKVNAQVTIPSDVILDGQLQAFTLATSGNWAGGTIISPLHCANSGHDITVTRFNADLTGAPASVKLLACQGDTIPTTYTRIHFTDNYVLTPGDGVALNAVSDSTVTGNYIANCAGACIDFWSTGDNAIITGNTVTVAVGAGIGIIYTAFNTDNTTKVKKQYANISHNHVELQAASGIGEGIYLQNLGTCTLVANGGANDIVADNTIHLADGKAGIAIWSDFCNYNSRITGNVIIGDAATVQTHPAIEVSGASSGIQIEGNLAYGWLAPTVGSDSGVFANKGENGSIINNKCFSCSALLVGATSVKASTIIYGNDDGSGTVTFTSPVTFNGAINTGTGALVYDLYQWGVPVMVPGSGAFAAGVVTLGTALPSANVCTSTTGCYMYFPLGAICATCNAGGQSAAGIYFCQNSGSGGGASTTVFNCFNNTLPTHTLPATVASPTPFTSPGTPAAYTQTTSSLLALITLNIPGGTMTANGGSLYIKTLGQRTNNGNTVIQEWKYGGTNFALASTVSVNWYGMERTLQNVGVGNAQVAMGVATGGTDANFNTNNSAFLGVSSGSDQDFVFQCQINTATDNCIIYSGKIQVN